MSQDLYDLPAGWEWVKLGNICDFVRGPFGGSLKKEIFKSSGFAVYEQQHAIYNQFDDIRYFIDSDKFEAMKRFVLQPDDIIMSCSGTMGKTAIVPKGIKEGIINQALLKLTTHERLYNRFLQFWMDSYHFQSDLNDNAQGAAIKNVASVSVLKEVYFPLPPLAEQTRIVEKLDAVLSRIDTAIDELQQSLALVDAFYKSSLKAKTNDVEEKWNRYSLNELGYFSGGGTPSKSRSDYWDGEILWITPKDMKSWKLSDSEMKITEIGLKESSAKLLPKNSVLIVARSGILQHTLPVAINTVEATVNQDIKVFIPNKEVMPEYVQYMLKGHEAFILSQLVKGGVTVESLKYSEFQEYSFPVPDIKKQLQIVGELNALNEQTTQLKTELTAKIDLFNQLKASVLDGAFRGLI